MSNVYEIKFVEIGFDNNHLHLLVQGIPDLSVSKMVNLIKGIIAREVFNNLRRKVLNYYKIIIQNKTKKMREILRLMEK
ncbi:MAG: transposase [Rickettsiales bacterium]|nr:transposase [Rickettsiales bacterium]